VRDLPPVDQHIEVVDLYAVALENQKGHPRLAGLIKKIRDLHSSRVDLEQAQQTLALRGRFPNLSSGESDLAHLVQAIAVTSIILYCRATGTESDHRKNRLDVRRWFDEEEKRIHEKMMMLRNNGIAHFGPGDPREEDSYRRDDVIIINDSMNNRSRIRTISRYLVVDEGLMNSLNKIVSRALILINRQFNKDLEYLYEEIDNTIMRDPGFLDLVKSKIIYLDQDYPRSAHSLLYDSE
jgi:hypothetical protein